MKTQMNVHSNKTRILGILFALAVVSTAMMPSALAQVLRLAEPHSVQDGLKTSQTLLKALESCTSPCDIQVGERRFLIETPALGRGERGVVFRLQGADAGQVLKVSRPDAHSLEILREEALSHRFWSANQGPFKTATRSLTHQTGLFSVMSEVRGESLTEALFKLGLLAMDPVTGDVRARKTTSHVPAADLAQIWGALDKMIQVVHANPQMRTSLSPNNLYVTWNSEGRISEVHLIDVGVDPQGDARYFENKSLSEYLTLAASKVQGYLKKPGFLGADLLVLQEQANRRFGLNDMFPLDEHRGQLLDIARKLRPGLNLDAISSREILDWRLPENSTPRITIAGATLLRPRTVRDLVNVAALLGQALEGPAAIVDVTIGNETLRIRRPALGQGDRGIVFAIEGTNEVIKIPKPNLISVLTLMNESGGYDFWHSKSKTPNSGFSVPQRRILHDLGLYSLMERDHGEPLTKAMLRFGMLSYDPTTGQAFAHPERITGMSAANRAMIEKALLSILQTMKAQPEMSLSISPNNLHVNYADAAKTQISSVVLIDVGLSSKASSKFDSIRDLGSYVEFSRDRLEKYFRVGYMDRETEELNSRAAAGQCRRLLL